MRKQGLAAAAVLAALVASGCTDADGGPPAGVDDGAVRLVAFDSCEAAMQDLRRAILPHVGAYGIGGTSFTDARDTSGGAADEAAPPVAAERATPAEDSAASADGHSTTNVHEAGVDEPDIVKTDGRRIVTVVDGTLRVVDAATRTLTSSTRIAGDGSGTATGLLLSDDHALVISSGYSALDDGDEPQTDERRPGPPPGTGTAQLALYDLSADRPELLASYAIDGRFVDARMVGTTVRVVTSSQPRFAFTYPESRFGEGIARKRNREAVENAQADAWLPRYRVDEGGTERVEQVACSSVRRASASTATSMLTVSTFDMSADKLGDGAPLTIVADGDIVYGTASTLYVASDTSRAFFGPAIDMPVPGPGGAPGGRTEVHKFDTSGQGTPRHVASVAVPGSLLNQYSMSEFGGFLRVAVTEGGAAGVSSVHVFDEALRATGSVGGLGKGERIYAVRYVGPLGYVVTFRQTDPLYTLDLRDPRDPRVTGELKITGYSAYLHPVGDGRLLGIGQEASTQGRALGAQVSLFDVSDPATPTRLAQHFVEDGWSEAEADPHAFLWWPDDRTAVLPMSSHTGAGGALVLRVGDADLTVVETLRVPQQLGPVTRTMMIGGSLWTLSHGGLAIPRDGTTVAWS